MGGASILSAVLAVFVGTTANAYAQSRFAGSSGRAAGSAAHSSGKYIGT
jgi:hypothetical protein